MINAIVFDGKFNTIVAGSLQKLRNSFLVLLKTFLVKARIKTVSQTCVHEHRLVQDQDLLIEHQFS